MAEQAEHTQVCEHCEKIFSFNLSQKWTLHGFHEAALPAVLNSEDDYIRLSIVIALVDDSVVSGQSLKTRIHYQWSSHFVPQRPSPGRIKSHYTPN
jgi:hypothetical protein